MKRPIYSVLAALAVSAALAGSAYAADKATQGNTQTASSAVTQTQAASPRVSRDSVRGGAAAVHVMKPSAIPDGWWKEDN